jgi:hypothetical protein
LGQNFDSSKEHPEIASRIAEAMQARVGQIAQLA